MLYSLQNGTEIHVTLLLITLIFHKTFKNCLFFYKMDDFNFIHYTQPVQEMHYHSSHQYLTKPSKLVYSS